MIDTLRLENLSAGYGSKLVLHDISLSVGHGELIAIIGPNGAGKSTLLKIMTKLLPASSGSLYLNGRNAASIRPKELAKQLSFVSQSPDTAGDFRVKAFAELGLFPYRSLLYITKNGEIQRVEEALGLCGAEELAHRKLKELSGGEKQLVCIARALVQNQRLVILDEPVAHLDVKHSKRIISILAKLNGEGSTIITSLHDINLAASFASRIIALKDGRVFFDGVPESVFKARTVEELFETKCTVSKNPVTGKPFVYFAD